MNDPTKPLPGQQTARDVQRVGIVKKHTGQFNDMAILVWDDVQPAEGTVLYAAPPASDVQPVGAVADEPQWHLMHDAIMKAVGLMQGDPTSPVYAKDWFEAHTVLRQALIDVADAELAAAPALQGESGATVADQRDAARWISVEDRLPELDTPVLVWWNDHLAAFIRTTIDAEDEGGWCWAAHHMGRLDDGDSYEWDDDYNGVTHWMPFPAPPEIQEVQPKE